MQVLHVVLYQPEIPPNTGNIARLCVATQSRLHLIEPLGFSIDDKQLKRAGLDYWPKLDLRVYPSFEAFLKGNPELTRIFYLSSKVPRSYFEARFLDNDVLVFGPETRGLPKELLDQNPGTSFTIPMPGEIRSINLSSAVSAVVYEALRQVWHRV